MKKRALLVGINKYFHYREKWLEGCVNDTKIMASVLKERFGFDKNDITILNDEEATRDAIVSELNRVLEFCESDDIILFHFSGHGTRRRATESGMPDGLEETIMTYDTGSGPDLNRDIRDSDLRNWLALLAKKTANINLIFDNCHSGSIIRGVKARGFETDARGTSMSFSAAAKLPGTRADFRNLFPTTSTNWLSLSNYYSLLTACQKNEYAWEHTTIENGKENHYGAFTFFLVQELLKSPLNSTYQDVFEQLRIKMQNGGASLQNPQIEGNRTRQLFSDVKMDVMQYVPVRDRTGSKVILSAGAVHGLTVNSQWGIYPSGTKYATKENKIGDVLITGIDAVTSEAVITGEETSLKIAAGCRAVEEIHYYKERKKSVYIDSISEQAKRVKKIIADDIKESTWLALADSETGADFIVSLSESSLNNRFQTKILPAGETSRVLLETTNFNDADFLKIRRNLETLSKYSMILELENPSSRLKNLVEFTLLQNIDGQWNEAEPVYNNLPKYVEGEQIAFRVINNSQVAIYISLLDLGLTKKIYLLYPSKSASERLGSNLVATEQNPDMGILQVGVKPNERITLFIPETAFLTTLPDINKKGGIEVFKLIAATEQTDFSWIEQDGMITRQNFTTPLEELFYKYLSERSTREAQSEVNKPSDWFTRARAFYLCKK